MRRLLLVLTSLALLAIGCGGNATSAPSGLVSPADFEAAVAEPTTVTINVLGPGVYSIAGTDLAIHADELEARQGELPPTSTRLAIYCMRGNTSAVAAKTLALATSTSSSSAAAWLHGSRAAGRCRSVVSQ